MISVTQMFCELQRDWRRKETVPGFMTLFFDMAAARAWQRRRIDVSRTSIFLLVLLAISVVWSLIWGSKLPMPFRARNCQGPGWRQAFPQVPKHDIPRFLDTFVNAFQRVQAAAAVSKS